MFEEQKAARSCKITKV